MGAKIKGSFSTYSIQPGRSIVAKDDGTLEGSVTYETDRDKESLLPKIGSSHPDDSKLEMYQRSITYNNIGKITMIGSFFGIEHSPTDKVINYAGGQNNDPIETHPDFEDFAGTAAAPLNGAQFDKESQEFLGFMAAGDFRGTQYWITAATPVSLSYWTDSVPTLKKRMTIVDSIKGFPTPDDVKNFLLLDTPYRQVGNFYQVTEQYLGSGEKGWNPLIYTG